MERSSDGVEADVRPDVDEVAVAEVLAHEVELAPVVEAEQEVALERLAQVELQPEAAGKRRASAVPSARTGRIRRSRPFPRKSTRRKIG